MGHEEGLKGEHNFIAALNKLGIPYLYDDDWWDFTVLGQKVEVKSTKWGIKNGKRSPRKMGRFEFTDPENREKQFKENIWVCFIVRHRDDYMVLGLVQARKLQKKKYISIPRAIEFKPISLIEFAAKFQDDKTNKT